MSNPASLFDRELLADRHKRRRDQPADFVTELVVADLKQRLAIITRKFSSALILGADRRHLPVRLETRDGALELTRLSTLAPCGKGEYIDPENFRLPSRRHDLIVSLLDITTINDVPGFLFNARRHLVADGLFMAAFVGGTSLSELRAAWLTADAKHLGGALSRVAPFISATEAGALLQRAGFALPVTDVEVVSVSYPSPLALMQELKSFGAANPMRNRGRSLLSAAHLASAVAAYQNIAGGPDGRVRASLEIVWMSGWAPHHSQQKPLAPGSARVSLVDVLEKKKR